MKLYSLADIYTEKFYSKETGLFTSNKPVFFNYDFIFKLYYEFNGNIKYRRLINDLSKYKILDKTTVKKFDFNYVRFGFWFLDKIINDVNDDKDNKPQIHNIFFSLTHTKYKPSHIFYIGQYKKFISKTTSSIGFPRGSILNIGSGIVGVKSIEHATMIMLMGYNAISFSEIAERIGNSVGMFKK